MQKDLLLQPGLHPYTLYEVEALAVDYIIPQCLKLGSQVWKWKVGPCDGLQACAKHQ